MRNLASWNRSVIESSYTVGSGLFWNESLLRYRLNYSTIGTSYNCLLHCVVYRINISWALSLFKTINLYHSSGRSFYYSKLPSRSLSNTCRWPHPIRLKHVLLFNSDVLLLKVQSRHMPAELDGLGGWRKPTPRDYVIGWIVGHHGLLYTLFNSFAGSGTDQSTPVSNVNLLLLIIRLFAVIKRSLVRHWLLLKVTLIQILCSSARSLWVKFISNQLAGHWPSLRDRLKLLLADRLNINCIIAKIPRVTWHSLFLAFTYFSGLNFKFPSKSWYRWLLFDLFLFCNQWRLSFTSQSFLLLNEGFKRLL